MTTLVLTVVGRDRPGLVNALAEIVSSHGANWEHSRLSQLAGIFAGVVEVTITAVAARELAADLRRLDGALEVTVHEGIDLPDVPRRHHAFELLADDRPGIVEFISGVFTRHGVSVEALATETTDAPMAGGRLFRAIATLSVPDGADLSAVSHDLEAYAHELLVTFSG